MEIWVVDDDQSVRWVLERALRQADMETRSFERAEHLLDALESAQPDVLITDVRMPGMDGLTLLDRLSHQCPDLPVIVVTAYTDLESAVGAPSAPTGHHRRPRSPAFYPPELASTRNGIRTWKMVLPGLLSNSIRPPWRLINSCAVGRPRPVPSALPVTSG